MRKIMILGVLMLALPGAALANPYAVDDAAITDAGACTTELAWRDGEREARASFACTPGAVPFLEAGLDVTHDGAAALSPYAKLLLPEPARGVALAVSAAPVFASGYQGTEMRLMAGVSLGESTVLSLNAGRFFARGGEGSNLYGVRIDHELGPRYGVVAEWSREEGERAVPAIALRYRPGRGDIELDAGISVTDSRPRLMLGFALVR
ncbi:MAG: hypothetical protein ACK4E3_09810 [Brevundimonas sp.]|jgi:hypothetical protein|uniref:hypothetical protein n=1 Tax=Brevundimonas sp. TaxID=1871086 RepID=UPI00391BE4ED